MELIQPQIARHLDALVPARPGEMLEMERYAAGIEFPIIGPAAGHFCYLLARLIGASRVFELGSGFGYSTAWFARAVRENADGGGTAGVVYHTVWDDELSRRAKRHLTALGYDDLVDYRVGESVAALRSEDGPFDVIFNDIDKAGYPASLDVIEDKLRPGGLLITDNLLWSGRIFDDSDTSDATEGVRELTRRVTRSDVWEASIVPIRDGLLVARKR